MSDPTAVDLEQLMDVETLRDLVRALRKENASWRTKYQQERQHRQLEAIAGAVSGGNSEPRRQ